MTWKHWVLLTWGWVKATAGFVLDLLTFDLAAWGVPTWLAIIIHVAVWLAGVWWLVNNLPGGLHA